MILEQVRDMLRDTVVSHRMNDVALEVLAKPLTPEEAIGRPERRDFPIVEGKERVIEAIVLGARGQAFTDSPADFTGGLRDVLDLSLNSNRNRVLFVATLNATLRYLNQVEGVVHCKDDDPETCAAEIAAHARKTGAHSVGLIGLNPAIAEALVKEFGPESVRITDLNRANIGARRFGVEILDGRTQAGNLIRSSDLVLITGTTLVNGTFDEMWALAEQEGREAIVYGVTAAGVCRLMNLPRICPCARN
jgi:uncharacterized protein (DUF4213/DUF364 family)